MDRFFVFLGLILGNLYFVNAQNTKTELVNFSNINGLTVGKDFLDCNCHTQGIAWDDASHKFAVSCQGGDGKAYLLLFDDVLNSQSKKAIAVATNDANRKMSHPSSIQICEGVFPVAISLDKTDSSFVYFYEISDDSLNKIAWSPIEFERHIGALAFDKIDGYYWMIGMTWDAKDVIIWRSKNQDLDGEFELKFKGNLQSICGGKTKKYNSLWLGQIPDSDDICLMASSGSFFNKRKNHLDFWKLNLSEQKISFQKTKHFKIKNRSSKTSKSMFYEGVTIKDLDSKNLNIIATPHDFKKRELLYEMKFLYNGILEIDF